MDSEDKFYRRCDRVLEIIKARPGITKSELTLATNSYKLQERTAVINDLLTDGAIEEKVVRRDGKKPLTRYWSTDHPSSDYMLTLNREVSNEPDTTQMTNEQIRTFNNRRREYNDHLIRMQLYPLPMLPEHTT